MADISKITLPNGNTYNIKDAWARNAVEALTGGEAITFGGVTTTTLTDGATTATVVVGGENVTPVKGQLYFNGTKEFLYDGTKWIELGNLDALGDLAYKDTATGSVTTPDSYTTVTATSENKTATVSAAASGTTTYTPGGTVSQPTFSGSSLTSTGTVTPSGTVSQPTFTGTGVRLVTGNIPVPSTYTSTFTGTEGAVSVSGTPAGSVSLTNSNKTALVSAASSGTATYTPAGSVSTPTISVKTAGSTTSIKEVNTVTNMVSALATAAPGATAPANAITYYAVSNENLQLYQIGATKSAPITTTNTTVKTGDAAYQSTQPSFTGTGARLITENISVPTSASFSGSSLTSTGAFTPAGTVSTTTNTTTNKTATVSSTTGTATYTPGGTISQPTFSGEEASISVSGTPAGTVSQPTFTGAAVRLVTGNIAVPKTYTTTATTSAKTVTVS